MVVILLWVWWSLVAPKVCLMVTLLSGGLALGMMFCFSLARAGAMHPHPPDLMMADGLIAMGYGTESWPWYRNDKPVENAGKISFQPELAFSSSAIVHLPAFLEGKVASG